MLEIRLLGPLEVQDDGTVLDVSRKKQRSLLATLALRPGEVVSADRLVDELWGERAPKTAGHAPENYGSEPRKTLGREAIRTSGAGYALDVTPEQVDAGRFQSLVARARTEAPVERSETYAAALSLVRGEPLEDLAYEPFAQAAAPRLL